MASVFGDIASYDYTQSYDVSDLRKNRTVIAKTPNSIFDSILTNPKTTIFSYILQLSGLQKTFDSISFGDMVYGGYTMFVPTDDALRSRGLNDSTIANLDRGTAIRIVKYSCLPRATNIDNLMRSPLQAFPSLLNGFNLIFQNTSCDHRTVMISDKIVERKSEGPTIKTATGYDAGFIQTDIVTANGYINLIDNLLIPDYGPLRECVVHGFSDPSRN
jgi:uncharacterized surface protein with fasciclin (FAS1) repeats